MTQPRANAPEIARWNDPAWTSAWLRREAVTEAVSEFVLTHLAPRRDEHVLEIGSGGGKLSIALAGLVGPEGSVRGVDVSQRLVEVARSRTLDAGVDNVTFAVADAQSDPLGTVAFEAAVSQFGVMFFDEPATAFANVARHVRSGGRFVFACWQRMEDNPWFTGGLLARYLPAPPALAAGKSPTGPFALADATRVAHLLGSAGWSDVEPSAYVRTEIVKKEAIFDADQFDRAGLSDADEADARRAVEQQLAPFDRGDGEFEIPLAFWVFAARRA